MRSLSIILLCAVASTATAAPKSVGLLVTGSSLTRPTQDQAARWLRDHDRKVVTNALPKDAVKTLLDCFVIDDPKCSSGLIDARATTDSFVSIRIDVASHKDRDIRLTIDWFVKGSSPVTARRTCEDCTESVLRTTIDAMLLDLAKTSPGFMGRVKVTSTPAGFTVLLDNETIGVTPIERDITAGKHAVRLVKDGRMGPEKTVKIESGALAEVTLDAPPEGGLVDEPSTPHHRSRALPIAMIAVGAAAVVTGGAMYYVGGPKDDELEYRDYRTPGIFTAAGGGVLAITGVIVIIATGGNSGPTVNTTAGGGATIGWTGRF